MDFSVSFTLSVTNPDALWAAAAELAMNAPGMTIDDVVDTIGSEHDPEISSCIAMLVHPARLAGCNVKTLTLQPTPTTTVERPDTARPTGASSVAPGTNPSVTNASGINVPGTNGPGTNGHIIPAIRRTNVARLFPAPRPSRCA